MMYQKYIKRIIDILFSLVLLPFVILEIIVFGPIIFLTDKGTIFYNAERVGKDGKKFRMFKLRSMSVNAPDLRNSDGSTFNGDNDPRVTKIGYILRKTSLDELPQILNVLLGHMSLIGPRPTVPIKGFELEKVDLTERKRYQVRPGITGYSQAYYRNSIVQKKKFELDAYYVDNMSFLLDVKILLKTIYSVICKKNIYNV